MIKSEQIEGEQKFPETRPLRGPEGLQTEPLDLQFRYDFYNALLDTRPPVGGAPHLHGLIRPVGHPQAEGVAGALTNLRPAASFFSWIRSRTTTKRRALGQPWI